MIPAPQPIPHNNVVTLVPIGRLQEFIRLFLRRFQAELCGGKPELLRDNFKPVPAYRDDFHRELIRDFD